jgi:hypothetical protein
MNFESNLDCSLALCSMILAPYTSSLISLVAITSIVMMFFTSLLYCSLKERYCEKVETNEDESISENDFDSESIEEKKRTRRPLKRFMDMQLLHDGLRIFHTYENHTWTALYDAEKKAFIDDEGKKFDTPSGFAKQHLTDMRTTGQMKSSRANYEVNGWTDCRCEVNGKWLKLNSYINILKKQ